MHLRRETASRAEADPRPTAAGHCRPGRADGIGPAPWPVRLLPLLLLALSPLLLGTATPSSADIIGRAVPEPPDAGPAIAKALRLRTLLAERARRPYPAPPGYLLPWPAAVARKVTQGVDDPFTHRGIQAWDFALRYELVVAARGGRVSMVHDAEMLGGCFPIFNGKGNYLVIDHGDGTSALYLHLDYRGVLVDEGDIVARGDPIAYSGSSGLTCSGDGWAGPHLHFQVQKTIRGRWWSETVPIRFDDVKGGVPVTGGSYVSGNQAPDPASAALISLLTRHEPQGVELYFPPIQPRRALSEGPPAGPAPIPTPTPAPSPSATPTPAAASPTSTHTPAPTDTPEPTLTPTPSPTPTASPTWEPTPTATAAPPEPSATPSPEPPPTETPTPEATATPSANPALP